MLDRVIQGFCTDLSTAKVEKREDAGMEPSEKPAGRGRLFGGGWTGLKWREKGERGKWQGAGLVLYTFTEEDFRHSQYALFSVH